VLQPLISDKLKRMVNFRETTFQTKQIKTNIAKQHPWTTDTSYGQFRWQM